MAGEVLFSNGLFWYCINLESLPAPDEEILSVAELEWVEHDWTLMGDHIYCLGRQTLCEEEFELYRHNTLRGSTWEIASSSVKIPSRGSLVWPLDANNILVIPENCNLIYNPYYDESEDFDEGRYAQVYNLHSKTWALTACHFLQFAVKSDCIRHPALIVDKKGQPVQLLYYSNKKGRLLFCDKDSYRFELHPNFALSLDDDPKSSLSKGILDGGRLPLLIAAMQTVMAVVSESTLYWFTLDFRLYGYDYIQKRWFQSPPLREGEQLLEPFNVKRSPILVDLYNGQFLMMHLSTFGKMEIIFLNVSKGQDSLSVSEGSSHTFSVPEEEWYLPWHAMAIVRSRYVVSLKAEVSKLKRKNQQLLGKDLTGLGVNELRLLERQVNEGLLAIRDRKDELLIEQQEHLRRSLDELRGLIPIGASGKRKEPETDFISSNSENQFGSK